MKQTKKSRALRHKLSPDIKEWHAHLRGVKRQLQAIYRKRSMLNPEKMSAVALGKEYDLLNQIFFTTFIPEAWRNRWLIVERAHSSMVVRAAVYPY